MTTNNLPDYYCPNCCAPRPVDFGFKQLQSGHRMQQNYCAACFAELMPAENILAYIGSAQDYETFVAGHPAHRVHVTFKAIYIPNAPKEQRWRWWEALPRWDVAAKEGAESAEGNSQP